LRRLCLEVRRRIANFQRHLNLPPVALLQTPS
jgi:hypothetical protein